MNIVIVGGGPCGLTIAWYLATRTKHHVTVIDKNTTLGGCHRVMWANGLFTEHGPRVYSSAFRNFSQMWEEITTLSFWDTFTPYLTGLTTFTGSLWDNLTVRELFALALQFVIMPISTDQDRTSVDEFATAWNFSPRAKDFMDRLCRLTDGAGSARYSLRKFLQLFNQNALYTMAQPRAPMDEGVFVPWMRALQDRGVQFVLGEKCTKVRKNTLYTSGRSVEFDKLIMAIPPVDLLSVIPMDPEWIKWAWETNYLPYLSITFHWKTRVAVSPLEGGIPQGEWGIVWIVLTDYFEIPGEGTVISASITKGDVPSKETGRTVQQSTPLEIMDQAWAVVSAATGLQHMPAVIRFPPTVEKTPHGLRESDTAYIATSSYPKGKSWKIQENIYSVGTHNGKSAYAFTSMEAAVTNGAAFVDKVFLDGNSIPLNRPWTVWNIVGMVLILVAFYSMCLLTCFWFQ